MALTKNTTFEQDFFLFLEKIRKNENFAFSRFSDGELYIMQNRKIIIENKMAYVRESYHNGYWGDEELKQFIPEEQQFYRKKLIECFKHQQENYYKGISCRCCVGEKDFNFQFSLLEEKESDYLTWSNLLINGNYSKFINIMVPELREKTIVLVCNKLAKLDFLPFKVEKVFRVGQNCHVTNYSLIEKMLDWVSANDIKNTVFLFSAASLSNFLIYELFKKFKNNTYIDIGSTLNPYMKLKGWVDSRDYLAGYWLKKPSIYLYKKCVW